MYGLLVGCITGSAVDDSRGTKPEDLRLFPEGCSITATAVLASAVTEGLLNAGNDADSGRIRLCVRASVTKWLKKRRGLALGSGYRKWAESGTQNPYDPVDWASVACIADAGWFCGTAVKTVNTAKAAASVLFKKKDDIEAAGELACAVFLASLRCNKKEIREYLKENFSFHEATEHAEAATVSQRDMVEMAITAFLRSEGFEDAIRRAAVLGREADNIAAMAGELAGAYYGFTVKVLDMGDDILPSDIMDVLIRFSKKPDPPVEDEEDDSADDDDIRSILDRAADEGKEELDDEGFAKFTESLMRLRFSDAYLYALPSDNTPDAIPERATVGDLLSASESSLNGLVTKILPDGRHAYRVYSGHAYCPTRPMAVPAGHMFDILCSDETCSGLFVAHKSFGIFVDRKYIEALSGYAGYDGCDDAPELFGGRIGEVWDDSLYEGNDKISVASLAFCEAPKEIAMHDLLSALHAQMHRKKSVIVPIDPDKLPDRLRSVSVIRDNSRLAPDELLSYSLKTGFLKGREIRYAVPAFTTPDQFCRGPAAPCVSLSMEQFFRLADQWDDEFTVVLDNWDPFRRLLMSRTMLRRVISLFDAGKTLIASCYDKVELDASWPDIRAETLEPTDLPDAAACVFCDRYMSRLKPGDENKSAAACGYGEVQVETVPYLPCGTLIRMCIPPAAGNGRWNTMISKCIYRAMEEARNRGIRRVAFEALDRSCGGYAAEENASLAVLGVKAYMKLRSAKRDFDLIVWAAGDKRIRDIYDKAIQEHFWRPGTK